MKIYVAASQSAASVFADLCRSLEDQGHDVQRMNVPPRYIEEHAGCCSQRSAIIEMQSLQTADFIAVFTGDLSFPSDVYVELGVALGLDKPVCVIGPRMNLFMCLPSIRHFHDVEEFLKFTSVAKFNFGAIQMPPADSEGPES